MVKRQTWRVFFFSSRRRHTRWNCDWSSDVCSSDLVFPSLSALAADSPASFSRVFAPVVQGGTAWNSALYLADSWRIGGLQLTYGIRLESARFSGAPPYNRAVDSLFALRTDRIPEHTRLSPRIGFMWTGGGGEDGGPTILRGGVGDFQSPTPTALYSAAL